MSLLESPIKVHADAGNGVTPMLLIGTEVMPSPEGKPSKIVYLCVSPDGEIYELTREWLNVGWRHDGVKWLDAETMAELEPSDE